MLRNITRNAFYTKWRSHHVRSISMVRHGQDESSSNQEKFHRVAAVAAVWLFSLYQLRKKSLAEIQNDSNESEVWQCFMRDLIRDIDNELIETDVDTCKDRAKPWSSYHQVVDYPHVIVQPESTEDVSKVLKLCKKYNVPVIPFGGGTSLEGQILTPFGGVSLDFGRMQSVIELSEKDLHATVQAGLGYIELNDILRDKGIWFPLDPGPGATVGGMCACRCSGSTAVRYGSMRDNVLGLTVVLPDGSIVKMGTKARKSSAGYDLTRLMIGSEGTLGVITEATLKLHGIPKVSYALRITFPRGVHDAASTAQATLNCGVSVGRCEMLDDTMVKIINEANPNSPLGPWDEGTTLLYELTGLSEASVQEQVDIVSEIAKAHGAGSVKVATQADETALLWKFRKECLWSAMSCNPQREAMITDVCVPLTKLADLIAESKDRIKKMTLACPIIAHAGDGNFHVLIMFKPSDPVEKAAAYDLAHFMAEKAIDLGGTCTGEHGIGMGKKEFLKREAGPEAMRLMCTIKQAIDPENIMNPGKVLDIVKDVSVPSK